MTVLCGVTQPGCTALTVVLFFVSRLSRHYLPLRPMVRMPKATSHQELSSCRSWPRAGGCCCPHCLTASVCRRAGPVLPCCPSHCACTACRDKARWWLNVGLQCPLQCPRVSILGAYHLRSAGCPLATETLSEWCAAQTPCPVNGPLGVPLTPRFAGAGLADLRPCLLEDVETAREVTKNP